MQQRFYTLISTFTYKKGEKYRFVLLGNLVVKLSECYLGHATFLDQNGKIRLITNGDQFTIFSGYAWDGNSPSIKLFGKFFGTPTPESTVLSSLAHDCFCQFRNTPCSVLTKAQIDEIFLKIMLQNRFPLAKVYYAAVRSLGGLYSLLGSWRKNSVSCQS